MPDVVAAQRVEFSALAGMSFPRGGAAEFRDPGLYLGGSLGYRAADRLVVRLGADYQRFPDVDDLEGSIHLSSQRGDLNVAGVFLQADWHLSRGSIRPYVLANIGAYRISIPNQNSPYGTTASIGGGIGVEGNLRSNVLAFVEGHSILHLTDYATGRDFSPVKHRTLAAGLRIRR